VTPVQQPAVEKTESINKGLLTSKGLLISVAFGVVYLLIAVAQAIIYRQWINGDSISYMDMGDAISTGDFSRLINPHWSPLYPALLGVVNALLKPGPEWEFPAAHLTNLLCLLFAAISFHYLLRSIWKLLAAADSKRTGPLPQWAFLIVGYSLFLYASLGMIALMRNTPDFLLAGSLYLAAARLIGIRNGSPAMKDFVFLGASLGVGYLAKGVMFPLGLFVLASTLLFAGPMRIRIKRTAAAALGFAVLAVPLVVAVSRNAHRLAFSESGSLDYMFFVNRLDWYFQDLSGVSGRPVHPVTKISNDPPAYSFASPHNATYSLWCQPFYWSEGLRPTFQIRRQIAVILRALLGYARALLQLAGVALAILLLSILAGPRVAWRSLAPYWPIIAMSFVLLCAYPIVNSKLEDRYIGAPISIIGLAVLCGLLTAVRLSRAATSTLVAVVALNLWVLSGVNMRHDLVDNAEKAQRREPEAALALKGLGFTPGTRMAAISPWISPGWARLTRLIIVADVPREQADSFWALPPERQASVLTAFRESGSEAVVGWIGGRKDVPAGWQRLGSSPYVLYPPR
jgi:hypothetical protein